MENFGATLITSIIGIIFIALGLPLALKKVKPNWLYGFRISCTLEDEEIWYAVNTQGGKDFIILGSILLSIGIVSVFYIGQPQIQRAFLISTIAVTLAGLAFLTARGFILTRNLTKEKELHKKGI